MNEKHIDFAELAENLIPKRDFRIDSFEEGLKHLQLALEYFREGRKLIHVHYDSDIVMAQLRISFEGLSEDEEQSLFEVLKQPPQEIKEIEIEGERFKVIEKTPKLNGYSLIVEKL